MTDHKFTDDDVIKALECCRTIDGNDCKNCAYLGKIYEIGHGGCTNDLMGDALALINHQKAENERLQKHNTEYARKHYQDGKAEAIKEFADKLKAILNPFVSYDECRFYTVKVEDINNLVKELTEGGK